MRIRLVDNFSLQSHFIWTCIARALPYIAVPGTSIWMVVLPVWDTLVTQCQQLYLGEQIVSGEHPCRRDHPSCVPHWSSWCLRITWDIILANKKQGIQPGDRKSTFSVPSLELICTYSTKTFPICMNALQCPGWMPFMSVREIASPLLVSYDTRVIDKYGRLG